MKKIIIPIIALFISNALLAQQEPQFTQNNGHNAFLVNPAAVGSDNKQLLRFFVRQNWAFFNDAPITFGASYQALLKDKHGEVRSLQGIRHESFLCFSYSNR